MLKRFSIIMATLVVAFFYAKYEKEKMNNYLETSGVISKQENLELESLPEISFTDVQGAEISIKNKLINSKKKYLFIHFWATWCAPCEAEFPELLSAISKSKADMLYVLVAVNDKKEKMNKFLNRFSSVLKNSNIVILMDDKEVYSNSFGTKKVPESYVFSTQNFKSIRKFIGPQDWTGQAYSKFFNTLQ